MVIPSDSPLVRRAAAYGLAVASGWLVTNIGAVATAIGDAYGVSLGMVGVFVTAQVVTHAVLQLPAGRAIDRFGAWRAGFAGLSLIFLASAVGAIIAEPALAVSARALAGVGSALAFLAGSDALRAAGGSTMSQGIYGGLAMAAAGIAIAVLPVTEPLLGWRVTWLSASAVALAALVMLSLSSQPASSRRVHDTSGRSIVGDTRLYRLALLYTATYGSSILVASWIVTFLRRSHDYPAAEAGFVGGLVLLAGMVARPLGGALAHRWPGHLRPLFVSCLVAGATATAALVVRPPLPVTVLCTLTIGIAAGIPFGPSFATAQRLRRDRPAAAVGFVNGVANGVIVVGVPLVGLSFSLAGDGRLGFIAIASLWASALVAVPSAAMLDWPDGGGHERRRPGGTDP